MTQKEKLEHISKLKKAMAEFVNAHSSLCALWLTGDSPFNGSIELTLTRSYPFERSFDEYDVLGWSIDSAMNLNKMEGIILAQIQKSESDRKIILSVGTYETNLEEFIRANTAHDVCHLTELEISSVRNLGIGESKFLGVNMEVKRIR